MTYPNLDDWIRFHGTFKTDPNKHVEKVEFLTEAKDAVSSTDGTDRKPIYFTDIQFQAGNDLSGWVPNTQEMLDRLKWTHDENVYVASPNRFEGHQPQIYNNVEKRFFNINGRGHTVLTLPNYIPQELDVPILPTGIDLTLYPKEDFDVCRVSTNVGTTLPESEQWYKKDGFIYQEIKDKYDKVTSDNYRGTEARKQQEIHNWENIVQPLLDEHPVHNRYTREMWVDGAMAGTEINVHANTRTATVDGSEIKIVGEESFNINGTEFPIDRKKFMLAPKGTATLRIEFYKQVHREVITYDQDKNFNWNKVQKTMTYLEDVGIGFHGNASFYQWTHGRSRI